MQNTHGLSHHAFHRLAQRNLTWSDVETVLMFGRVEYRTGVEFYFLGWRDLPDAHRRAYGHLVGTVLIVNDDQVVTAYRNEHALPKIRRKSKINFLGFKP